MEINTTNISLDRYLHLVEIEKNFNKKFKVVYSYNGSLFEKKTQFYSDNDTFENEIIESQNKKIDKLSLEIENLKSVEEKLRIEIHTLENSNLSNNSIITKYENKNLIERIFNL
jgi:hypothetical protein